MTFIYNSLRRIGLLFAGGLILVSCADELDKVSETDFSDETYWNNGNDLQQAANNFYFSLPLMEANAGANMSDDGFGQSANAISEGSRVAPNTEGAWTDNYRLIRQCNNLIEKSARVNDAAAVARYRGEARFFRAWAYFELVKRYGDVPLIMRTFDIDDPLVTAGRTDRDIVLDSAYADLDFATANLPGADVLPAAQYGRITRNAALALKARIGLHEGTWNKFHSEGDPTKHLNIAIEASQTLMQTGQHSLFTYTAKPDSSYYYLFQYAGEGRANRENILSRIYGENTLNEINYHIFVREYLEQGRLTPTQALVDSYLYVDGLPREQSPLRGQLTNSLSEFQSRDPRLGMTVFNRNAWFISSFYRPTFSSTLTGFRGRKYFIPRDWTNNRSYIDNIVIRYAEVLLINAEAKYELNGSISDDDLNSTINLIRARAKMPALTNAFVAANGLDMRTEIRRERRVELAMELDFRYFDLIRWKTAEVELPKSILGARFFQGEYEGVSNPRLNAEGYVIVQDASTRRFNPARDYLSPLPVRDIGLNPNLNQNPNWDR